MREEILVVGGAGYIGSHVAKILSSRGYKPVALDDLSSGHKQAARGFPLIQGNYADISFVEKVLKEYRIGTVMHFGAKALVGESIENPLLYYATNVGGTVGLLTAMRNAGVRHFVFSSTCATFGEPAQIPIHETVEQKPVNPYGQSKLFVEKILKDLERLGFRSAVLRYFNAAGADLHGELGEDHRPETHLIPRAISVALGREKELVINGGDYATADGSCVRDYVHVNDLAEAHIKAMELIWEKDASFDFNLGTERGCSVFEVVQAIERASGKKLPVRMGPRRPGDPPTLVADSRKARDVLGWKPVIDLDTMVQTAYEWMKAHPNGYDSK